MLIRIVPALRVVCVMCRRINRIVEPFSFRSSQHIVGARVGTEIEQGCVHVCVRACCHVSTREEFLPHIIFCLVSV